MAALASIPILTLESWIPKSFSSVRMPRPSVDARTTAYNLDLPELLAITDWALEYDLIRCDPIMVVPPEVDLRCRRYPAQFASEVTSTVTKGACQQYFHTSRGRPFKYRPMRFSMSHQLPIGLDIIMQHSLTAYWMSGLSGWR